MRKSEFVAYILALRGDIRTPDDMKDALLSEGFEKIGRGVDKEAFWRKGDAFVVKVRHYNHDRPAYNALSQVRKYQREGYYSERLNLRTLVPMAYSDGLIQIQPKVVPCKDNKTPDKEYGCYSYGHPDGHAGNHTHASDGRVLLFDYD